MGALVLCIGCGETSRSPTAVEMAGGAAPVVDEVEQVDECAEPVPSEDGTLLDRPVTISSPSDVEAIAHVGVITGTLTISSLHSGPLRLPNLRKVGSLEFVGSPAEPEGPNQTTSLELPNLLFVDDQLSIYLGWNLIEVDLHSLQRVGTGVFIDRNVELRTLRLDSLTDSPEFELSGNLSLPSCMTESVAQFGSSSANGDADTRCHCEIVCGHLEGRCDDVKTP